VVIVLCPADTYMSHYRELPVHRQSCLNHDIKMFLIQLSTNLERGFNAAVKIDKSDSCRFTMTIENVIHLLKSILICFTKSKSLTHCLRDIHTPCPEKRGHVTFNYNSRISWSIFIIFVPLEQE